VCAERARAWALPERAARTACTRARHGRGVLLRQWAGRVLAPPRCTHAHLTAARVPVRPPLFFGRDARSAPTPTKRRCTPCRTASSASCRHSRRRSRRSWTRTGARARESSACTRAPNRKATRRLSRHRNARLTRLTRCCRRRVHPLEEAGGDRSKMRDMTFNDVVQCVTLRAHANAVCVCVFSQRRGFRARPLTAWAPAAPCAQGCAARH
jgi:hypothetical protein